MPSPSQENSHKVLRTYSVKHRRDFSSLLECAKHVANYAAAHKFTPKLLSTKMVKHFGLPSDVSNQILRKYGRGTIRTVKSANLIVYFFRKSTILFVFFVCCQGKKLLKNKKNGQFRGKFKEDVKEKKTRSFPDPLRSEKENKKRKRMFFGGTFLFM